jgi:putative DNA primase/helicase
MLEPMKTDADLATGQFQRASLEQAREALGFISADCDRDTWFGIGAALYNEFGDTACEVFDTWSQCATDPDRYDKRGTLSTWRSIKNTQCANPKTFATIARLAREGGWKRHQLSEKMPADEAKRRDRERAERQAADERDAAERRAAAADLAHQIWDGAVPADSHAYLLAKGIGSNGARIGNWPVFDPDTRKVRHTIKNALLLEIRDFDKRIHSVQAIYARPNDEGKNQFAKRFLRDGEMRGHFFPIGQPIKGEDGQFTFIVAGRIRDGRVRT